MTVSNIAVVLVATLIVTLFQATPSSGMPSFMRPTYKPTDFDHAYSPYGALPFFHAMPQPLDDVHATAHAVSPVPPGWSELSHNQYPTTYKDWSYAGSEETSGIVWGLEPKGALMETKTPFMMTPVSCLPPLKLSESYMTDWSDATPHSAAHCNAGSFVSNLLCKDKLCSAFKLQCSPLGGLYRAVPGSRAMGFWNHKGHSRVYCNGGSFMDGMECRGACNEDFMITCSKVIQFDL